MPTPKRSCAQACCMKYVGPQMYPPPRVPSLFVAVPPPATDCGDPINALICASLQVSGGQLLRVTCHASPGDYSSARQHNGTSGGNH